MWAWCSDHSCLPATRLPASPLLSTWFAPPLAPPPPPPPRAPAERLCDDLAALIPTMVKPVVDIAWFSWQLWRLTGRRGMVVLIPVHCAGLGVAEVGGGKDDGAEAWWLCWGTMWVGCPAEELGVCASGTSPLACKAPFRLPRAALSFIYAPPPPRLVLPPLPQGRHPRLWRPAQA